MSKHRSQQGQRQHASSAQRGRRSAVADGEAAPLRAGSNKTASTNRPAPLLNEAESAEHALDDANISDDEEGGTRIGDIYIPPPVPPHCSTESKGPRLVIKQIVNKNFKSYAGTVTLGPFHHRFSAIIGPNGSGKSNVIDSMLFVFGYRANKIRCKKISTLLHNSAKFPNMSSCSVAVHFGQIVDGEDGSCEEVPDSSIIVERTAFRDNSSFYTINGRRVQFKEVAKLLKKHHVDLDHNRFLILQGEVESIAMMKPKGQTENECGMLEYLEDIVGTTRYKEPLVKINERVEQLTEERTEKHNRCKLAEREMKDLEQPYNEAVEYLRRENENTRTKNLRIQKYLSEKNKKLEEYTKDHEIIKTELKEHDAAAEVLKSEREEKEKLIRDEIAQFEKLRKAKEELEKKLEKASSNFTEVQQQMSVTNNRRKQNKTQLEKHENEIVELRKVPAKNQKEISECGIKAEKLNKQKMELEEELQKNYVLLEEQTKPLIEKREQYETELVELKRNVDEAKAELAVAESELKLLKHDETTETRKYETLKASYEESENGLEEKRDKIEEMKRAVPTLQQDIVRKTRELQKLHTDEKQLDEKLKVLKAEINEKEESSHATRSNNKVLNFLMLQKHEGKIPGILGRLGDLGAIDAKYDVAISTACGRLDNIIVDTVNSAQECIEQLKRHDVGRASFIALEKVKHLEHQSGPIQTPEQAPRLYDLVRVEDERVLPAFYFALRNTLVANDLEQGTRIAYGARRFRVVTLKGDVIETSGTMSGGGRTQIRGKMGTKVQTKTKRSAADTSMVSDKALNEMRMQAEELQSQINYLQQEQGRVEHELDQMQKAIKRNEAELQKLAISITSLEEQLPRIHKQLEAQKKRMQQTTTDAGKVKKIEQQIEERKQTLKQSEAAADKVVKQIACVKQKIDEVHGDKVKAVQSKINSLGTQIKKLNGNISKLKVEVTTSERNVAKMEKQIENMKADILKAQEELTVMATRRQEYDDETINLSGEIKEAQKAIEGAKSQSSGVQKEITALQKREDENKLKRVEIDQKLQTVATKLAEVKSQLPHWRDQLKPLRLHEIPGDAEPQPPLKTYTEEELAAHTLQDIQYKESVQEELLKKKPNLSCIGEYIDKRNVYLERVKVLEDITSKRNEMRQLYDDVRKKRYNEFMQGFQIITRKLKEMYQMITQGGDAELELVDSMDPFTEGVSFSVRPPRKTWKNISNLSGGEKTLSSLALVFALHYYKPSPLYFMDEIDAALDFKNISIVAHYIKERTKNAQFIIISLRSNMFELSDFLVGIYKVQDCTNSVTIKNVPPETVPLTQMQSQNQPIPMDSFSTENSFIQLTAPVTAADPDDIENAPPKPQGRDTTFAPPSESTALTQMNLSDNTLPRSSSIATGDSVPSKDVDDSNATSSSINDAYFKKPLPPPASQKSSCD